MGWGIPLDSSNGPNVGKRKSSPRQINFSSQKLLFKPNIYLISRLTIYLLLRADLRYKRIVVKCTAVVFFGTMNGSM